MLLEVTTLQKIAVSNLLIVTVNEQQLSNNFTLILQALTDHTNLLNNHSQQLNLLDQKVTESCQNQQKRHAQQQLVNCNITKQQQITNQRINVLQNNFNKLSSDLETVKESNPESSAQEEDIGKLEKIIANLQQKIGVFSSNLGTLGKRTDELNIRTQKGEQNVDKLQTLLNQLKDDLNSKLKENEKDSRDDKLGQKLKQEIEQLKIQLAKLSGQVKCDLQNITQNTLPKLKESQEELKKQNKLMSDQIWKLNDQLYNSDKHQHEIELANKVTFDSILKRLQDLQYANLMKQEPSTVNKTMTPRPESFSPKERELDTDFKKEIFGKLQQQRAEFGKAIKRLDVVNHKKGDDSSKFDLIEQRLLRLEHLLDGKVDEAGLKKWMKLVENKLTYLYRIISNEATEQDAYIVRKNWFCLSCDRKLDAYKGKPGQHLANSLAKVKGVQCEMVGGGMLFKSKSRYELPQCKK